MDGWIDSLTDRWMDCASEWLSEWVFDVRGVKGKTSTNCLSYSHSAFMVCIIQTRYRFPLKPSKAHLPERAVPKQLERLVWRVSKTTSSFLANASWVYPPLPVGDQICRSDWLVVPVVRYLQFTQDPFSPARLLIVSAQTLRVCHRFVSCGCLDV